MSTTSSDASSTSCLEMAVQVMSSRSPLRRTETLPSWLATQPFWWSRRAVATTSARSLGSGTSAMRLPPRRGDRVHHGDDQRADGERLVAQQLADAGALAQHQHQVAGAGLR